GDERQLGGRVVGLFGPDFRDAPLRIGNVAVEQCAPRVVELLFDLRTGNPSESGPRIDEIAILGSRRHGGGRPGRGAGGEGNRRENDDPSQINSIAAVKVSRWPASSQCTFRSARSHVSWRFAYARVRRFVSAIAASSAIVPSITAIASR